MPSDALVNPVDAEKKRGHRKSPVLRTSLIVFLFLVCTKILNFVKKVLIGKLFGVSTVADTFFAASYLPYYLTIFFEGILFLGFLPLFSQVMSTKGKEEASQFVGEILFLVVVLTCSLTALAWWGAPWITRQIVPGFRLHDQELTCDLFKILSLVIIFLSLTSLFKALNSYFEDYAAAASAGLVDTLIMMTITLASWKLWGIRGAAWGSVAGALCALIFQAAFLVQKHLFFAGRFSFETTWILKLFYFLVPMGAIWFFQQIPLVILNRFGSGMWQGTISALTIAQTLTTVPMGLVSHTVLFAIFPSLTKQANETGLEHARATFFQTLRGGFLILIPVGFLLSGLARPLASLFFSGGGILEEGTRRIANALGCLGAATFALYADLFMTQSLIAIRKTVPAILLCASRAVLTYAVCYILSTLWDYQGLAVGFSAALAVNFFLFFPVIFRLSPFVGEWKSLFVYCLKLMLAASPVSLVAWLANRWSVAQWTHFPPVGTVLAMALMSLAGAGAYWVVLLLFRIQEVRYVMESLKPSGLRKDWSLADPGN